MKIGTVMRLAAVLTAMATGVATGATSGRWTAGIALAAAPPCANYQLTMQPIGSNGATGHISEMFRIHELLPGSCMLFGYPGAVLLNGSFTTLPTHVTRAPYPAGGPGPRSVTLDRSHSGYFVLSWVHFPTPGQRCPFARYVMITAPNDRLPVVSYAGNGDGQGGINACGGNVTVSPVARTKFWS